MKNALVVMIVLVSVSASAGVKLIENKGSNITVRVTGADVATLKEMLADRTAINGLSDGDPSNFRSISCGESSCDISIEGETATNKDTADYFTKEYNDKLKSLTDNQVLVTPAMRDGLYSGANNDGRVLRILVESQSIKGVTVKLERRLSQTLKPDQVYIPVMNAQLKLSEVSISCHSGVGVWSDKNIMQDSCSLEVVAEK